MRIASKADTYDRHRERAWHLSVWLAPEMRGWCVHDLTTGKCLALFADKGNELPQPDELPVRPMSVSFTALPEISTLVPESALVPGSELLHLQRVHGRLPAGQLREELIGALSARCVYLHDEVAEQELMRRYPNAHSLPLQAVLVQGALSRSAEGCAMLIHRSATRLDLAIARKQQLLLSNTYHALTSEDVLFYTLFALEQCGVPKEEIVLHTAGTHLGHEDEGLLQHYIPTVRPALESMTPLVDALNAAARTPSPH